MNLYKKLGVLALAVLGMTTSAIAAPPDFSALVAEADFSTVTIAVLAVAAVLATVYVSIKGSRIVLSFLRS